MVWFSEALFIILYQMICPHSFYILHILAITKKRKKIGCRISFILFSIIFSVESVLSQMSVFFFMAEYSSILDIPHFLDLIICWWTSRLTPCLWYYEVGCYRHWSAGNSLHCVFSSFGYRPKSGRAGSYSRFICNFLWNLHIVFHNGHTNLQSH